VTNSHHDWGATMDSVTTFYDCPAYVDWDRAVRCGLPAEVEHRYSLGSTDGSLASVKIRCPQGHWFSGPVDVLIRQATASPELAADMSRAGVAAHWR
jgi:hypothetical protein